MRVSRRETEASFAEDSSLEETGFEPSVPQPRFEDAVITVLTARRFFRVGQDRQPPLGAAPSTA